MNELLERLETRDWVLDVGCGSGSFAYANCRARVLALDLTVADVAPATSQRSDRIQCLVGSGDHLPIQSGSLAMVIANHVFEHVENPAAVAAEISRVLKTSGVLFATVPHGFSFSDGLYRWWTGGGGHIQRYTFQSFERTVENNSDMALLFARRLYSSFSFLNPNPTAQEHLIPRSQSLRYLPRIVRLALLSGMNLFTRATDFIFGARASLYGWAFYFGKPGAVLPAVQMEEMINVCAFCGSGHSYAWLEYHRKVRWRFGLRTYVCEQCGCRNLYFGSFWLRRLAAEPCEEVASEAEPARFEQRGHAPSACIGSGVQIESISTVHGNTGPLAPGMLVRITGQNLAAAPAISAGDQWPLQLADVQVLVNGAPIPLHSVSSATLVAQLPFSLQRGLACVVVNANGNLSPEHYIAVNLTAPVLPARGDTNLGDFYHMNGEPVTAANPARANEYITFRALGLGPIVPPVAAGQPAPEHPLSTATRRPLLAIANQTVAPQFCGLAPGSIGYYQVNFQMPVGLSSGEKIVQLQIGGQRSNAVHIAVGG